MGWGERQRLAHHLYDTDSFSAGNRLPAAKFVIEIAIWPHVFGQQIEIPNYFIQQQFPVVYYLKHIHIDVKEAVEVCHGSFWICNFPHHFFW